MKTSEVIKTEKGFFIGDPCYVFEDGWDEIVDGFYAWDKTNELTVNFKGSKLGMANTAYGDGCYEDGDQFEYMVDAGLIGLTPLEVVEKDVDDFSHLGKVVYGKLSATISEEDGKITFNFLDTKEIKPIVIDTKDYDDEDAYYEDGYEDEYEDEYDYGYDEEDEDE